jgi:hypothetical protein
MRTTPDKLADGAAYPDPVLHNQTMTVTTRAER